MYARNTAVAEDAPSVTNVLRKGSFSESAFLLRISQQKEVASLYEDKLLRRLSRESSAASLKEKTSEIIPLQFTTQEAQSDGEEDLNDAPTSSMERRTAEEVFTEVMTFKKRGIKIPAVLQREASTLMGLELPKIISHDDDSVSRALLAPTRPRKNASRVSSRAPSPGPSSAVREPSLVQTSAPPVFSSWSASLPPRSQSAHPSPGPSAMRRVTRSQSALIPTTSHAKVSVTLLKTSDWVSYMYFIVFYSLLHQA
jgi:hypothetical protein